MSGRRDKMRGELAAVQHIRTIACCHLCLMTMYGIVIQLHQSPREKGERVPYVDIAGNADAPSRSSPSSTICLCCLLKFIVLYTFFSDRDTLLKGSIRR